MNPPPAPWNRPYFRTAGPNAFLSYALFGTLDPELKLSSAQYRTPGLPDGFDLVRYTRQANPSLFDAFLASPELTTFLRADHPALHRDLQSTPHCVRIQGELPDPPSLDYLRDVVGVVTAFLDQGAIAALDLTAFRWWPAADWRRDIFDPAAPVPRYHVSIFISDDPDAPGRSWFHTRGLRKFARPDISITNVPRSAHEPITDLCNRLIEMMAFGAIVPEGEEIRMRSLPPGMTCQHAGHPDDPDFNNTHIRFTYPPAP